MSVLCAQCGETLLGSVNRCWRCGREVDSRPGPVELPPVRREPVTVAEVADEQESDETSSERIDEPTSGGESAAASADDSLAATQAGTSDAEVVTRENAEQKPDDSRSGGPGAQGPPPILPTDQTGSGPTGSRNGDSVIVATSAREAPPQRPQNVIYHGSPFAPLAGQRPPETPSKAPAAAPIYPQNAAASGGAIASFCLGLMSLSVAAIFWSAPVVALILAILGICMGIWGMFSNRRGFAGVGLALCIAAFGWSGFMGVVQVYTMIHGVSPFQQAVEPTDMEMLDP